MDKIFAQGIWFKPPRQNAPEFVKGSLSIKVKEFVEFITRNQVDGNVSLDLKVAKTGNYYIELNTYQRQPKESHGVPEMDLANGKVEDDIKPEDIPF